jgi:hypothetical protein
VRGLRTAEVDTETSRMIDGNSKRHALTHSPSSGNRQRGVVSTPPIIAILAISLYSRLRGVSLIEELRSVRYDLGSIYMASCERRSACIYGGLSPDGGQRRMRACDSDQPLVRVAQSITLRFIQQP